MSKDNNMVERVILQAKKLALVDLRNKIDSEINSLDTELDSIPSDDKDDDIPF
tara:strand:+ start:2145 stop:2303 length:159 start_codon:yes stop_codon:yes gene_type:complete